MFKHSRSMGVVMSVLFLIQPAYSSYEWMNSFPKLNISFLIPRCCYQLLDTMKQSKWFLERFLQANVMNNRWVMPTIAVTSLIASNVFMYWHMNKKVIAAEKDFISIEQQLKNMEKIGDIWIEKLRKIGITVEIFEKDNLISFFNLAKVQLQPLNIEKLGIKYVNGRYNNDDARIQELEGELKEVSRQKDEAIAIEKALTQFAQEEVVNLIDHIKKLGIFLKSVKVNIIIPDNYDHDVMIDIFNRMELPLLKSNNTSDKYIYFYNDPESGKRKITVALESQQPLPPKGVFSPPMQRRTQDKG